MRNKKNQDLKERCYDALVAVRHSVDGLHETLKIEPGFDRDAFLKVLDSKLLTRLDPDYPLMVAITGGGSTGKSSLFNSLVGQELSAVKAKAGLSRRVLAAIHPEVLAKPGFIDSLFEAFGVNPEPLGRMEDLTEPGVPMYVACDSVPRNLVLLDTPDFDTGDGQGFVNRNTAKAVLEACDVFLYIFTNATYNNLANTNFIREMLTGIGSRSAILIYRCSRVLTEDEIQEHAKVVLGNIYGDNGKKCCLGIYRVNEDDDVASGQALMRLAPVSDSPSMIETLAGLDVVKTREKLIAGALKDVMRDAQATLDAAVLARAEIELYRDAARVATSWASSSALEAFPADELLRRFLKIWEETQPGFLKRMKRVGHVVAFPMKPMKWVAKKVFQGTGKGMASAKSTALPEDVFRRNLSEAANELHNKLVGGDLAVETGRKDADGKKMVAKVKWMRGRCDEVASQRALLEDLGQGRVNIRITRPAVLEKPVSQSLQPSWEAKLKEIHAEASQWVELSPEFDKQLIEIADRFRSEMGFRAKVRETFTASLPSLAVVAAASYVVFTGDPVGGSGIYAHLAGMFGVNDLFALIAIPASSGLNEVHRKNLEKILTPTYEVWYNEKVQNVRETLERHVAGDLLVAAAELLKSSEKPVQELEAALKVLHDKESRGCAAEKRGE